MNSEPPTPRRSTSIAPPSGLQALGQGPPYRLEQVSLVGGSFYVGTAALNALVGVIFGESAEWVAASPEMFFDLGRVPSPTGTWSFLCFRMLVKRPDFAERSVVVTHAFIDKTAPMTVGREVFGFPAVFATFDADGPAGLDEIVRSGRGKLTISTDVLTKTSNVVAHEPIVQLTLDPALSRTSQEPYFTWHELGDATPERSAAFIQLRQIRDAIEPARACFQESVKGSVSIGETGTAGGAGSRVTISDFRSFRLASSLGLRDASDPDDGEAELIVNKGYCAPGLTLKFAISEATSESPESPIKHRGAFRFRSGDPQFAPEYEFHDVRLTGFKVPVSRASLKRLIDRCLNDPYPARGYSYQPATSDIIVECVDYGAMAAENPPPGLSIGDSTGQHELIFRVLTGRVDRGSRVAKQPTLFCPFIWVDSAWSLISGREIMGYPKELAAFEQVVHAGEIGGCRILADAPLGRRSHVLSYDCRPGSGLETLDTVLDKHGPARRLPTPRPKQRNGRGPAHPWWGLADLEGIADLENFVNPWLRGLSYGFGAIQLKRFANAKKPGIASYFEVLESEYSIRNADVELPPHRATLHFGGDDPFGLRRDFGLSSTVLVPPGAWYRATCDFRVRTVDPLD